MNRSMVFIRGYGFGCLGRRVGKEPLACRKVAQKVGHGTGPTGLVDCDVRLANMGRCTFHVATGAFIETMGMEILAHGGFGEVQVFEKQMGFRSHIPTGF